MLILMKTQYVLIISSIRTVVAAALILTLSGSLIFAASTGEFLQFPDVEGVTLDHTKQVLPQDFKGRFNLVLMAFGREQQPEIDTWFPELRQLALKQPGFDYYELPVIGPKIAPLRWIIRKGMGSKITEPTKRLHTILVFAAKDSVLKPLAIASEEAVIVLLLDQKGRVLWRSAGPWNAGKGESLRRAVEAAQVILPGK